MDIIFYGAGQNAAENFDAWCRQGFSPVCFVDADPRKHYTTFMGLDVLPLSEAIKCYPDYTLYCTQSSALLHEVHDSLISAGIPEKRIKSCEGTQQQSQNSKWRFGCTELNHFIRVSGVRMFTCCYLDAQRGALTTPFEMDYETTLKIHTEKVKEVIRNLSNDIPCVCSNCPSLQYGFWEDEPNYTTLALDGWFKDDVCNINCCYCGQIQKDKCNQNITLLEAAKALSVLLPNIKNWFYTGGEPSIYPQKQELFDYVASQKWMLVEAFTNAVVYEKFFSDRNVSFGQINCSLDAGTRGTYQKIKGLDLFDKVVQNLEKYSADGCDITLKYILLGGLNDNAEDVEQFLTFANRIGAKVSLSFNQDAQVKITKGSCLWPSVERFVRLAHRNHLNIHVEFWPLGTAEIEAIQTILY